MWLTFLIVIVFDWSGASVIPRGLSVQDETLERAARVKRLIGRPLESTLAERKSTTSYGEEPQLEKISKKWGREMKDYSVVLFDLDGTLSDPKIGITKSVQYALEKMEIIEEDLDRLETFIGPPLQVSLAEQYAMDEAQIHQAIAYYRERFSKKGENMLYPHVASLLANLKEQGYQLAVATSKPTVFAEQILSYFNIEHFFDLVAGSHLDGTRSAKGEIIEFVLENFSEVPRHQFIMIGDRKYDIVGAQENQIDSIGVTYGFGSLEELQDAQATYIVNSVHELQALFSK